MFEVEPVKKITVTEQIMEKIALMITDGKLRPGEQLPNERSLAEHFGVSRGRIREALRALSLVGLVTIKSGEGSFVSNSKQPMPKETITWLFHNEIHNLDEMYDARKLIEWAVYLSTAKHASDNQLKELEDMLPLLDECMLKHKGNPIPFADSLDQLDLYAGEICGNQIYSKLMQTMVHLRRSAIEKLLAIPHAMDKSIETRNRLIRSLKTRNLTMVEAELEYFFSSAKTFFNSIF